MMATFETYNPISNKSFRDWKFYAWLLAFFLIFIPIIIFMPTTKSRIALVVSLLIFILIIYLIGKFYNWKYNGGAKVNVTKERIEIKFPNSERKVFSINTINKIMSHDNSSAKYIPEIGYFPLLLTFTIWTSSPLGKVRLRFMDDEGKKFIKEILKYKKPKKEGRNIFLRIIHDNLKIYYF